MAHTAAAVRGHITSNTSSQSEHIAAQADSVKASLSEDGLNIPDNQSSTASKSKKSLSKKQRKELASTIYTGLEPLHRPSYVDNMIRERVSIRGVVRPLENVEDLVALQIPADHIGLVRLYSNYLILGLSFRQLHAAPVKRYLVRLKTACPTFSFLHFCLDRQTEMGPKVQACHQESQKNEATSHSLGCAR